MTKKHWNLTCRLLLSSDYNSCSRCFSVLFESHVQPEQIFCILGKSRTNKYYLYISDSIADAKYQYIKQNKKVDHPSSIQNDLGWIKPFSNIYSLKNYNTNTHSKNMKWLRRGTELKHKNTFTYAHRHTECLLLAGSPQGEVSADAMSYSRQETTHMQWYARERERWWVRDDECKDNRH